MLTNMLLAGFKLRLDQGHDRAAHFQNLGQWRQNQTQRNKRYVNRGKLRLTMRKISQLAVAEVGLLHYHDARIIPELPNQLIGTNI